MSNSDRTGVALPAAATVRAQETRTRLSRVVARPGQRSPRGNRGRRNVPAHGFDFAAAAARGALDHYRRQSGKPPVGPVLCEPQCPIQIGMVLPSQPLQRFVLRKHERAFRALLPGLGNVRRVEIVGGGMFPRTALILQRLLPEARLTIIDASLVNLRSARFFVNHNVQFVHDYFDASPPAGVDLVVIPLAFIGDRAGIYRQPPARTVLVHDWLWHRRGTGVIISWSLLKRLNLIRQ